MWAAISELVQSVHVESINPKDPVRVFSYPDSWRCIGVGNSAAVFQPKDTPEICIKVYANNLNSSAETEAQIYRQLGVSDYFPEFFEGGQNYLVIAYRPGKNIYDCLVQGQFIPEQVLHDIDNGITYARAKGLNPCDIHAKNVIVHNDRGYLIDVSDYRKNGTCRRWDTLRQAYYDYYQELYQPGLTLPIWLLETVRKWYKAHEQAHED
ncbi:MAG TPA: hypothetical protein VFF14_03805, partial [Candidatus Deferrimicrobium sp.]|nr:hypothetical protein [Candidatus Deferrimicrobium sp.]